jgi:hypothetical protein
VHRIVENQVALGDVTVAPVTLARLMVEGLNRYEAVQAIGSVLIGIIFDAMREKSVGRRRHMAASSPS